MLFLVVFAYGCGGYNKVLKSEDKVYKLDMAVKYHDKKDFDRAMPLLEELRQTTVGDTLFERVSYYYAKSHYGMKDYVMAGYLLDRFAKTFRNSPRAEECSFLAALCHYRESPSYELDQTDTRTAVAQLELFMVRYPETGLRDSCNALIDELRAKLELKEYMAARQYQRTRNYRAASDALRSFLRHWPNSSYREDVLHRIFQSDHDLAVNSVPMVRPERSETALKSQMSLVEAFPEGSLAAASVSQRKSLEAKQEQFLFEALQAAYSQAQSQGERTTMIEKGIQFFDSFALRFPESKQMAEAVRLREELARMKAQASTTRP